MDMNDLGVIHLTNGGFAVVDADLWPHLNQHKWRKITGGYIARTSSAKGGVKRRLILLHREVNGTPDGVMTDHENSIRIDNTRRNLRDASRMQNGANRSKYGKCPTSTFKGLSRQSDENGWRCSIRVNGKYVYLGYFMDEREGAAVYNAAAVKHFGEFARLNPL